MTGPVGNLDQVVFLKFLQKPMKMAMYALMQLLQIRGTSVSRVGKRYNINCQDIQYYTLVNELRR